jgi:antitoxin (DNA-binding transcriptional repressor) of toxin-antitoxin stability system
MKQVRIAELEAKLSEFLRAVQGGESITVLDRNTAFAQIVPMVPMARAGLRIRKPASGSPPPNQVLLPEPAGLEFDMLELQLAERQFHR